MANTIDPLGGSYFVEDLTTKMERGCFDYFRRIDELGGMVEAIEAGFPQREIMDAAYAYQRAVDAGEKIVVGVNEFVDADRAAARDPLHRRLGRGGAEERRRRAPSDARREGRDVRAGARCARRAATGPT